MKFINSILEFFRTPYEKEVMDIFKIKMLQLCIDENIRVEYFDNVCALNEVYTEITDGEQVVYSLKGKRLGKLGEVELAIGKYCYVNKEHDTPERRKKMMLPAIKLVENDKRNCIWTLAHELGHHYTIQYQGIEMEEAADKYIMELAKKLLTRKQISAIKFGLMLNSGVYN